MGLGLLLSNRQQPLGMSKSKLHDCYKKLNTDRKFVLNVNCITKMIILDFAPQAKRTRYIFANDLVHVFLLLCSPTAHACASSMNDADPG
jgi:hypothetical protein